MMQPTEPARIAVLDMGKTRLKLLVASEDGWPLETRSIPNTANTSGPYLTYDLARLEEWFLDTLAKAGIVHVGPRSARASIAHARPERAATPAGNHPWGKTACVRLLVAIPPPRRFAVLSR
jgi:hypothetical protein